MTFEISLDSLPLELLENIISFVPDDKTLASCAQVCRRWVPASRTTLFRSLSLPNDLRTRSFLNLLDNDTQSTLVNARIKHLNLSSSSRSGVGSDSERVITSWASRTPKTRAALHAVFGQLDSLSVRFTSDWVTPDVPEKVWYSTITSLRLEFVDFDDQNELTGLLKSCPALKSLEMSSIEVTLVEQETEPKSSYIPSRLESLSISYTLDPATLALVAPFCSSLRKFEYDWHTQQYSSARSLPGVGAILRAAEDTLEELSLKTGSWAEGVSFDEGIDALFEQHLVIARLPALRRLALDISTIYLLPVFRRLVTAYDAQHNNDSSETMKPLPAITHLYIPAIGYKSSFDPNSNGPPINPPTLAPLPGTESAPVFQYLNKNLHEALELLLPLHPVFQNLTELRCDADDLYNAADFAIASPQFFQSQYFMRMQAKEARAGTSRLRSHPVPYSSFVPFTRSDTALALGDADADAEADADFLAPSQFMVGSTTTHRYPRPGTISYSRLRMHVRKLRSRMPACAAKGIPPIPVVRYWFNDVATGLVAEETLWASGNGYADTGDNWEMPGDGDAGAGTGMGMGTGTGAHEEEEDVENMGGMQGLSMKGMEIWDSGKGRILLGLFVFLLMAIWR